MADYSSNITVSNGYTSSVLTRSSYSALQGSWVTPPRQTIGGSESDSFVLGPPTGGSVSEGQVVYRTNTGTQVTIYFKCASGGNTATVTPPNLARVEYNPTGTPLNATYRVLEAN